LVLTWRAEHPIITAPMDPHNDPCFKPSGYKFVDWKSTSPSVIPAEAGIQVVFGLAAITKMDAGLRRHDKSALCLDPVLSEAEAPRDLDYSPTGH
jgi:hypothetical protein